MNWKTRIGERVSGDPAVTLPILAHRRKQVVPEQVAGFVVKKRRLREIGAGIYDTHGLQSVQVWVCKFTGVFAAGEGNSSSPRRRQREP